MTTTTAASRGEMMTVADVCTTLGIGRSTLYRWWSQGRGPTHVKLAERTIRVARADLHMFIAEMEVASL